MIRARNDVESQLVVLAGEEDLPVFGKARAQDVLVSDATVRFLGIAGPRERSRRLENPAQMRSRADSLVEVHPAESRASQYPTTQTSRSALHPA